MPPQGWELGEDGEPVEVDKGEQHSAVISARFTHSESMEVIKYAIERALSVSRAVHDLVLKGLSNG